MEPISPPSSPRGASSPSLLVRPRLVDTNAMIPLQEAKDDSPAFKFKLKFSEEVRKF
jgi:hypothetical protein